MSNITPRTQSSIINSPRHLYHRTRQFQGRLYNRHNRVPNEALIYIACDRMYSLTCDACTTYQLGIAEVSVWTFQG